MRPLRFAFRLRPAECRWTIARPGMGAVMVKHKRIVACSVEGAARVLREIVENQRARTAAALKGLREGVFARVPPDGGHSIRETGRHMLSLARMQ